jgi:beta-N-acetylhexosaminidase
MGGALRSLGFDVDFAPVADLGPAAPGTGLEGRLYGDDPETVSACCAAFLEGLSESGVEGCLKHFPGLGGSAVDSHSALPEIPGGVATREDHLEPYRLLARRAPYVMTAHALYESLGGALPSSLEPETYALLAELGFGGLSVTDDLGMGAVSGRAPLPDLAASALQAGASLALWVSGQEETLRALDELEKVPAFLATRALLVDSIQKEA